MKEFIQFLLEAKKQTYANGNALKTVSTRNGSNDYEYSKIINNEKIVYHDTYFGGVNFIGEEVVYENGKPYWAMNYYGTTINKDLSEEAIDFALRPALIKVGEDNSVLPLRGPSKFENNGYTYTFKSSGTVENFKGIEEIYKGEKLVYNLICHGGIIK